MIWIGLDGDDVVSGHLGRRVKIANMERDPASSCPAPHDRAMFLNPYAVIHARASVEPSERAWDLLDRLTKLYLSPDTELPAPRTPGFVVRYQVGRISGVGPWA